MAKSEFSGIDKLSEILAKTEALVVNTCGEAGDSFRSMNPELQDNYLWAVSDLLTEAREALDTMLKEHRQRLKVA